MIRTYDKNEHAKELAAAWRAGKFDEVLDVLCGPSRASSAHRCYLAVAVYREIAKHDCVGLSLESRPSVVFLALLDARSRS